MALVDYSSSSSSDEAENNEATLDSNPNPNPTQVKHLPNLKRKRAVEAAASASASASDLLPPPLPSRFHDLYASTTRRSTTDDPSLHEGRKRAIPHIEGNWPTHLYVEWYPSRTEDASLTSLLSALRPLEHSPEPNSKVHSLVTNEVGVPLPLHISLSRSLGFVAAQKDEFVDVLGQAVRASRIPPFHLAFSGLKWVANFEGTRWFLVLRIPRPEDDGLNKLLLVCNSVVKQYNQPLLYQTTPTEPAAITHQHQRKSRPSVSKKNVLGTAFPEKTDKTSVHDATEAFHISLAWTLQSPSQQFLELTEKAAKAHHDRIKRIQLKVKEIKCKMGNVVTSMPLPTSILDHQ